MGWLGFATLLLLACENDPEEVKSLSRKVFLAEEAKNIQAIFSQSAQMKAKLTAPLMYRVRADTAYAEFPQSIHVDFYKEDKGIESVVEAKYGKYYETLAKVFLRDSVIVYNTSGDTLRCNTLWWDQNQEIFYTNDSVVINTPAQQLRGTGFWALADLSKYTITNTVGTVALPDELGNPADSTNAPDSSRAWPPAQQ